MRHKTFVITLLIVVVLLLAGGIFLSRFSLSAIEEPGHFETELATKGKRFLVGRSARGLLPAAPAYTKASAGTGRMIYMGDCAACHGNDGRTPSEIGRSMYPRALDLSSAEVQEGSDAELFWIIQNGIRLSGMPGFGKLHQSDEIWKLVHYVRSLRTPPAQ